MAGKTADLYHEIERKAKVGDETMSADLRAAHLRAVHDMVRKDPYYVDPHETESVPVLMRKIPLEPIQTEKPLSIRILFDGLGLPLRTFGVDWRLKWKVKPGGILSDPVQCIKIGRQTDDRIEIEKVIDQPGPAFEVLKKKERRAIEEAIGRKLEDLSLRPLVWVGVQSRKFPYHPAERRDIFIEQKHDRGVIVSALDLALEADPIGIFEVEQELKRTGSEEAPDYDMDGELDRLIKIFNAKSDQEILRRINYSKPTSGFERLKPVLSEVSELGQRIMQSLPEHVDPRDFKPVCMGALKRLKNKMPELAALA